MNNGTGPNGKTAVPNVKIKIETGRKVTRRQHFLSPQRSEGAQNTRPTTALCSFHDTTLTERSCEAVPRNKLFLNVIHSLKMCLKFVRTQCTARAQEILHNNGLSVVSCRHVHEACALRDCPAVYSTEHAQQFRTGSRCKSAFWLHRDREVTLPRVLGVAFELFADYDRSGPSTPRISAKLLCHGLHNGSGGPETDG